MIYFSIVVYVTAIFFQYTVYKLISLLCSFYIKLFVTLWSVESSSNHFIYNGIAGIFMITMKRTYILKKKIDS